jgi:hypothetical protein
VAADSIAMFSRAFSFAFASMVLCSCAELLLIATRSFNRACFVDTDEACFVDTDEARFFDDEAGFVDTDEAKSNFVDRDEADFLDEEQANKGLLIESRLC